jgi:hypothetical protein
MISVSLVDPDLRELEPNKIVPSKVVKAEIPFDKKRYEKIQGTNDYTYYLELLEEGFIKASKFKDIPLDTLLNLIKEFKNNNCKNEWLHKKKQFKEEDLEVILTCEFTTNYFQLIATIKQLSSKKELVKGVVLKTVANEIAYEGMFKDIIFDKNIVITYITNIPIIIINKKAAFKGKLDFKIIGDEEVKKRLSYKL